ncbi:MAG: flagellin [Actinobacteria bacterium]|nr:flagellin [Actinomycetota bacterium]
MRINQNIAAFNAFRNLSTTSGQQAKSLEKLSSGFRINRAADDAAGLVNSENLRAQIGGLKVATRNAQDAISLVQTAEGAQTEVHSILQRMRDLTVQSGNVGVNDEAALRANQDEITELATELDRIAEQTQFGTKKILDGSFAVTQVAATNGSPAEAATISGSAAALAPGGGTFEFSVDGTTYTLTVANNQTVSGLVTQINTAAGATVASLDGSGVLSLTSPTTGSTSEVTVTANSTGTILTNLALTAGQTDSGADAVAPAAAYETGGAVFQVGANADQVVRVGVGSVEANTLGTGATGLAGAWTSVADIDLTDTTSTTVEQNVSDALKILDDAISTVSSNRAELGAFQNRMESTIRNVGVAVENLSAAESRIRDTDMAAEMVSFTRHQIMQQAGTAMLAQANQVPQSVLSLLR